METPVYKPSDSSCRLLRADLARRAHETAEAIEQRVQEVLKSDEGEGPPQSGKPSQKPAR
jgi:hypothetical protein